MSLREGRIRAIWTCLPSRNRNDPLGLSQKKTILSKGEPWNFKSYTGIWYLSHAVEMQCYQKKYVKCLFKISICKLINWKKINVYMLKVQVAINKLIAKLGESNIFCSDAAPK